MPPVGTDPPPDTDPLLLGAPRVGRRPDRLVVVVGTGTDVGKTWVSAALLGRLRAMGHPVWARKPAQSFDPGDDPGATDAAVLGRATGEEPCDVCPPGRWYPVAMAPPMAAEVLGRAPFTAADLTAEVCWPVVPTGTRTAVGLVETAGGVRSPQADDADAVDLVRLLRPDVVVVVADAGLGAVNSVRLTVEALAAVSHVPDRPVPGPGTATPGGEERTPGLADLAVVLNRFDPTDDLHRRNKVWLVDRDRLCVAVTPGDEDEICRLLVG